MITHTLQHTAMIQQHAPPIKNERDKFQKLNDIAEIIYASPPTATDKIIARCKLVL